MELFRRYRVLVLLLVLVLLFVLYINGLSKNPPGFSIDESGISYNAYLVAQTGRGEFGPRFPLFFQIYSEQFAQYASPTHVYLLAIPFLLFRPSIVSARAFSAVWIFAACLLLGFLAKRISGQRKIGVLVAAMALLTPWLFEVSRLVLETYFFPMALVLFLLALHYAQSKQSWSWLNIGALSASLALLTYSYSIGRLLGVLFALGLGLFGNNKARWLGIFKTWFVYGLLLAPLFLFNWQHPGVLSQRFFQVSYFTPRGLSLEVVQTFLKRYLEDLSPLSLLVYGDGISRHHVPGSLGSFLVGAFILAIIGLILVVVRHWREPWWRFVLFGLATSLLPGVLGRDQLHTLRLIAYPIFLLLLTIPALGFLLARPQGGETNWSDNGQSQKKTAVLALSPAARRVILAVVIVLIGLQAFYFQFVFHRDGPGRRDYFDATYKDVYDAATTQPQRPIYLVDGVLPSYVHAYWYATVEGRNRAEFVHLDSGKRVPAGALVISSEIQCVNCEVIRRSGKFVLYRAY